jgi:hypothetical protein
MQKFKHPPKKQTIAKTPRKQKFKQAFPQN